MKPEPVILMQGEYRAGDRMREWRVVRTAARVIVVEIESDRDAMGNIVWAKDKNFCTGAAGPAILNAVITGNPPLVEALENHNAQVARNTELLRELRQLLGKLWRGEKVDPKEARRLEDALND